MHKPPRALDAFLLAVRDFDPRVEYECPNQDIALVTLNLAGLFRRLSDRTPFILASAHDLVEQVEADPEELDLLVLDCLDFGDQGLMPLVLHGPFDLETVRKAVSRTQFVRAQPVGSLEALLQAHLMPP